MERTLVIVKPDGVQRGLIGDITERLERRGLKLVGIKMLWISRELAETHYDVHKGKPFYNGLIDYITSAPVVAQVWEGLNAITAVRNTLGKTNPAEADAGSIRGDYGLDVQRNLVHGSDAPDTAEREIGLFFQPEELTAWQRATDRWVMS
jgi:nucleoside-diphosphate kinase